MTFCLAMKQLLGGKVWGMGRFGASAKIGLQLGLVFGCFWYFNIIALFPAIQEARAYAEAVGWETQDVEFIATRLWLGRSNVAQSLLNKADSYCFD